MIAGEPGSGQTYEVTYRWKFTDVVVLPLFAGMVLFGGWNALVIIRDPTISNWWVLTPFEPQMIFFLGVLGLLMRLGSNVFDRSAIRIDSYGILLEAPWPFKRIRAQEAWSDVAAIELLRFKLHGVGPISVQARYLRLWPFGDPESLPQKHNVRGLRLDRNRLTAAIRYHAPHVRIVDQW